MSSTMVSSAGIVTAGATAASTRPSEEAAGAVPEDLGSDAINLRNLQATLLASAPRTWSEGESHVIPPLTNSAVLCQQDCPQIRPDDRKRSHEKTWHTCSN